MRSWTNNTIPFWHSSRQIFTIITTQQSLSQRFSLNNIQKGFFTKKLFHIHSLSEMKAIISVRPAHSAQLVLKPQHYSGKLLPTCLPCSVAIVELIKAGKRLIILRCGHFVSELASCRLIQYDVKWLCLKSNQTRLIRRRFNH